MRQLSRQPGQRGLTLIEVMVALAISAILLGVAAPFFGDYIANSRLREGGNALLAEALYAQSEALKRNGTVRLSISGATMQVIDRTGTDPITLRTRTLADGLSATAATTVDFGGNGMPTPFGTAASIDLGQSTVTCSSEIRCPGLRIDAGGSMRLCGNRLSCS